MTPNVSAYDRFRALGAVLDVARFPLPTSALHEVPVRAMRVFARRNDDYLKTLDEAYLKTTLEVDELFRITLDPDVASGRRILQGQAITTLELFGPGYDLDNDTIRLFEYRGTASATTTMKGLAYALLNPPYGLRDLPRRFHESFDTPGQREQVRMRQVLREFCAEVLSLEDPKRADHLTIHGWPTDWSSYFDAGNEWWGSTQSAEHRKVGDLPRRGFVHTETHRVEGGERAPVQASRAPSSRSALRKFVVVYAFGAP